MPDLLRPLMRFLLLAAALGWLAVYFARPAVESLLPLFRWELRTLDTTFRIDRLYIARDGADQVVRLEVGLAHPVTLNGRTFSPDPRGAASVSTLVGNVMLPCVLLIAVALAWPAKSWRSYPARLLTLVPASLLLWTLGAPLILLGLLWRILIGAADPHRFSLLLGWTDFLLSGGGLALAIALGAGVGSTVGRPAPDSPSL